MLVSPIIKSRKHIRHRSTSRFSLSGQCPFQNGMLELLGLYRADDLILLLFCSQQILSGIHVSQVQTNILHMTEVRHMNGQGMHKSIFCTETQITVSWLLQMSSPSIT